MESNNDSEIIGEWLPEDRLTDAIAQIVAWFKDNWGQPPGLPPFELNKDGHPIGSMNLLPDLADYLPYLYLVGTEEYVRNQVTLAINAFQNKHVILTPKERRGLFPWWKRSNPFYSTDFLWGLVLLHRLDADLISSDQLTAIARRILHTYTYDGWMSKEVILPFRWRLPLSESDSLLYVEIFTVLYELTGEVEFLTAAKTLVGNWLNHPFTKTWGLVPQLAVLNPLGKDLTRFRRRANTAILYKHNTSLLSGLLALHQLTKGAGLYQEAALRLLDAIEELLVDDKGAAYFRWVVTGLEGVAEKISLGNTLIIEHLLDAHQAFGRHKDLETAIQIADYWVKLQDKHTGLIPDATDVSRSDMDHQTDFAVNLHRLYYVTENQRYLVAAARIASGQIAHHRSDYGYVNSVDSRTGKIMNTQIETRYSSLFLKSLYLLKSGGAAWEDVNTELVMKDR
jgi:hypothetical protein